MPINRRSVLAIALASAATAPTTQAQNAAPSHDHAAPHAHPPPYAESFYADMDQAMDRMMRDMHAPPRTGSPDIDFLVMMIAHHAGAVDMARLVLRDGTDPKIREMAEMIISTQNAEIEGMRGRLMMLQRGEPNYPMLTGNRG